MAEIWKLLSAPEQGGELSAGLTVVAMLVAATLAKLDFAPWGTALISVLCAVYLLRNARSAIELFAPNAPARP